MVSVGGAHVTSSQSVTPQDYGVFFPIMGLLGHLDMLQFYIVGKPLFWGAMGVREGEKNAGLAISECRV